MTCRDTQIDGWMDRLDSQKISEVEERIVRNHEGDVTVVPTAVLDTMLGWLLSSIETDIDDAEPGKVGYETHVKYAYAVQLHNCLSDDWNGRHK